MASKGPKKPSALSGSDKPTTPQPRFPRVDAHRPVSVVSSRMTDIASEDEVVEAKKPAARAHRPKLSDTRPETARTGASSKGPGHNTRPHTKSHLEESRPGDISDNATDLDGSVFQDLASLNNHITGVRHMVYSNGEEDLNRAPPSRGTEDTEQEACDRSTASSPSPTPGQQAAPSMCDSVRALHRSVDSTSASLKADDKDQRLAGTLADLDKHKPQNGHSNFAFAGADIHPGIRHNTANTGTAEKHSSIASSSRLNPGDPQNRRKSRISTAPTHHPPSSGKVYEYFEGNTVFFFGGRWQNTRQRPINIATGLFMVVPCVLFFVFEAPWLWHNISPALPIIFAYLAYICFSSFLHASISDPGILPRNLHHFPPLSLDHDPLRVDPPTNDWTLIKSAEPTAAAMEVPVKHCRTCNIWRPPRAHHCRLCDNCIETHDHHCVWLNNCVGKRNYRYFFTFVSSATILSAYLMGTSLAQVLVYSNRQGISFGESIKHFRVPFALIIVGFILFCYPGALMSYHIFLMSRGETTREFMNSHKFAKKERYRAFSTGHILSNLLAVLCRPRSPTYYQFKKKYRYGDQRLGIHRNVRPRVNSWGLEMSSVAGGSGGFQGPVALQEAVNRV
ncbi:Palmitoyltransferase ERF2 [Escovopsis weberi]|uniref:Palmitoyltransferase n=1 Tax=Escovopsis weberi TaxID=150374 RepID=A0A0M9VVM1_ESCWE|nr:Palmitoyltransferase ERF2 [Escovopsis weberi]